MFRSALRSLGRFSAAVILLVLLLCAVEVGVRVMRVRSEVASQSKHQAPLEIVVADSTSFYSVKPLIDETIAVSSGQTQQIRTNELGLRHGTMTIPKPIGTYRVLCLGSGATFGIGVDQQETSSAQLGALLSSRSQLKIEVINAGCPKAGPLTNVLRLRQRLLSLQPDLIVLNISPEDLLLDRSVRGALVLDELGSPAYAPHPKFIAPGNSLIDTACEEFATAEWALNQVYGNVADTPSKARTVATAKTVDAESLNVIVQCDALASSSGATLIVAIVPSLWAAIPDQSPPDRIDARAVERALKQTLDKASIGNRVLVINSVDPFERSGQMQQLFSPRFASLSAQGQLVHAQTLAGAIAYGVPEIAASMTLPNSTSNGTLPSRTLPVGNVVEPNPRGAISIPTQPDPLPTGQLTPLPIGTRNPQASNQDAPLGNDGARPHPLRN